MVDDIESPLPFPYPLPTVDPAWLAWHGGVVRDLAVHLHKTPSHSGLSVSYNAVDMAILADALEEASCTDAVLLQHLRTHDSYRRGCWHGTCWALNLLLGLEQTLIGRCPLLHGGLSYGLYSDNVALNPGDWFGRCYAVTAGGSYEPPMFIVEAASVADAIDVFVDSPYGVCTHIDPTNKHDNDDYGWHETFGSTLVPTLDAQDWLGWTDLCGKVVAGTRREPSVTGAGTLYDGDNISIYEIPNSGLRYFGPGLPLMGVRPEDYCHESHCDNCGKDFFPNTDGATDRFCSQRCVHDDEKE